MLQMLQLPDNLTALSYEIFTYVMLVGVSGNGGLS